MRKRNLLLAAALAVSLSMAACGPDDDSASANPRSGGEGATQEQSTLEATELRTEMRALWEDHITWTRLFIVSAVEGLDDVDVTAERLLANQKDIGDAIKPYLGDEAGVELNRLLDEHILVAADLVAAAASGDDKAVAKTSNLWYRNGNDIADFLADAGIGSQATLRDMMKGHLDATLEEAVARINGDHEAEIAAYDKVREHIHHMSDALTDGILKASMSAKDAAYDY